MRIKLLFLLSLVMFSANAAQAVTPNNTDKLNFIARYDAVWLGITVGKAVLEVQEQQDSYKAVFHLKSQGIAKNVTSYWSKNQAFGKFTAGQRKPEKYISHYRMKKKKKKVILNYIGDGKQAVATINPPERKNKRKKTSDANRYGAFDPIVAGLKVRDKLIQLKKTGIVEGTSFNVPCFDGKRRFDIVSTVLGRFYNKKTKGEVIKLKVVRKPVAGFSNSEKERMKDQEPVITFMVDAQTMMPELALAEAPIGKAKAKLVGYCQTVEKCWEL